MVDHYKSGEQEYDMKMLTIICRENLEGSVVQVLNDLGVKGYTVTSGLGGRGETGTVSEHSSWTDRNVSFMAAINDQQVTPTANAMKQLYMKLLDANHGEEVPLL
jgi:nitrogen regulatory protein PII